MTDKNRRCLECGKLYEPQTVTQKYCSMKCRLEYRRKGKIRYPSVTFNCACCGKKVITREGIRDMRTKFCCKACEKKYWKHPHRRKMNLQKFDK